MPPFSCHTLLWSEARIDCNWRKMYEGSGRTGCQEKLEAATHLQSLIFCVIWSGYLYF